jgi:hypothetical protein
MALVPDGSADDHDLPGSIVVGYLERTDRRLFASAGVAREALASAQISRFSGPSSLLITVGAGC